MTTSWVEDDTLYTDQSKYVAISINTDCWEYISYSRSTGIITYDVSTYFPRGTQCILFQVMKMVMSFSRDWLPHPKPLSVKQAYLPIWCPARFPCHILNNVCRSTGGITWLHKTKPRDNLIDVERLPCVQCEMASMSLAVLMNHLIGPQRHRKDRLSVLTFGGALTC